MRLSHFFGTVFPHSAKTNLVLTRLLFINVFPNRNHVKSSRDPDGVGGGGGVQCAYKQSNFLLSKFAFLYLKMKIIVGCSFSFRQTRDDVIERRRTSSINAESK